MMDVLGRRCDHPGGCSKIASFGLPGSSRSRCSRHKDPGMICVYAKNCDHPEGCSKRVCFGPPGGVASRCTTHRDDGMVMLQSSPVMP